MGVIPVIDLLGGVVVRGVAGRRDEYRPISSGLAAGAQPGAIARVFVQKFKFHTAYVADLDAIGRGRPDHEAWRQIAAAGLALWLDAGIGSGKQAQAALHGLRGDGIPARLVIGMESLQSLEELPAIIAVCENQPPIFSLDLKSGQPLTHIAAWRAAPPLEIALRAAGLGITALIVLDLADVGMGGGTRTLDLCRRIRREAPQLRVIAGGGVRGVQDLQALAEAGCAAALVASALHDGRLTPQAVSQAQGRPPPA